MQPVRGRQGGGQAQLDQEQVPKSRGHRREGPASKGCFLDTLGVASQRNTPWEDLVAPVNDLVKDAPRC